ncbi:hypothetical protein ABU162_29960 [Paenibacillus thiaminolyticus]|uniref:hypothetical protein n=1 Tax=Paenibacillus thiaminolyticus TaxID=49283 RepID=UPI0035A57BEB
MIGTWLQWKPVEGLQSKYQLVKVTFDCDGLAIILASSETSSELFLQFKSPFSFRTTDEGKRLKLLNRLNEKFGDDFVRTSSLFMVYESEYLKWINDETYYMYENQNLYHFVILTDNEVLEILSPLHPVTNMNK